MTTSDTSAVAPVRKQIAVSCTVERAFELFTAEIGAWWPLDTHAVGGAEREALVLEARVGGQVYERLVGGRREIWGEILAWEPPARLLMSWHPGRTPAEATEVEVRFHATEGGSLVELEHRGWERRTDGPRVRMSYDTGWDTVLGSFCAASARARG